MPFNNLDQQGLGGEPVGHIHDATEGVGGLGGDADGVPIGMGAGAEPLGMAKGKGGMMDDHGGAMQGLNEDGEGIRGGTEDVTRPFNEAEAGEMEAARGGNMLEGKSSNGFVSNGMPNGGGNNMGGFAPGTAEGMPTNGGGAGNNFMEQPEEEGNFRGPKKDPLGGEIRPFNDEFKNDDGKNLLNSHGSHGMSAGGGGGYQGGGMNKFSSPPASEEGDEQGGGAAEMEQQEFRHGKGQNNAENLKGDMDGHSRRANTKNTVAHHKHPRAKSLR